MEGANSHGGGSRLARW